MVGSDGLCKVGEGDAEWVSPWLFGGDLVAASVQVLDERVPRGDRPGGAVSLDAAHRSESFIASRQKGTSVSES